MNMDWKETIILFLLTLFCSATVVGAKIVFLLGPLAPDPPTDPELFKAWSRRRRWLAYAELSALPAFAVASVAIVQHQNLQPLAAVLISMVAGAVGFTLLLDGIQWVFRKRAGLPELVPVNRPQVEVERTDV